MPDNSEHLNNPEFQALLVSCLESLERGESVDSAELARQHPQFADALNSFLDDRQLLEDAAHSIRGQQASVNEATPLISMKELL